MLESKPEIISYEREIEDAVIDSIDQDTLAKVIPFHF